MPIANLLTSMRLSDIGRDEMAEKCHLAPHDVTLSGNVRLDPKENGPDCSGPFGDSDPERES